MTKNNDATRALDRICEHVGAPQYAATHKDIEDIKTVRTELLKSAQVDGLVKALKPFANVADKIKEHATDNRWLEQCLFSMGDDADPLKYSLTGKAFNDASNAIHQFSATEI